MGLQKSGTTDNFAFFYQNKDHLGTVRETVTSTGAMKQRVNYYPFGGQLVDTLKAMVLSPNFQQYKYNGKEFDGTFGLNTYDYGARQHYPILARWDRIDPLCEKYYGISPYAYCANNPVNNIDLHGDSIFIGYEYQQEILEMINNVSEGVFDVDENGYLYLKDQTKPSVDTGKYSKYYQEQLVYGINSSNTISVRVASEANYKGKSFQLDNYGQGLTITDNSQAHVYVSGESHTTQSGTYCNPSIILAHELAGHAIPSVTDSYMQSSYDGLAVSAENTIRSEIGLPLRNWGSYEEGHRSVSSFINPIGRVITNRQLPIKK
ncbi:MAG: RHS repeat-associated core domain-containing protein [Prevotella sp.]|nr:RHS repeat-associated core domain-containing protein [Prevotella sp.]